MLKGVGSAGSVGRSDEPDWIADLLEDFDAGSDPAARRRFVEHSVRLCASLKLQLETVLRCVVLPSSS